MPLKVDESELDRLRRSSGQTLYYLGRSFEGYPLTHVSAAGRDHVTLIYGDCDPGGDLLDLTPDDGGCAPPVQIQHFRFDPAQWAVAEFCRRVRPIRGVPAARHSGLVLFTGRSIVKIYGTSAAQERRIAKALRPLNAPHARDRLPPPPRGNLLLVEQACGRP
ncbi:MAG: hypothetical protein M3M94_03010 [Actinomycetota bacterium]|nr:hypothetical protein [Actinomycetota bacterium]